jgi:hypothetical protein
MRLGVTPGKLAVSTFMVMFAVDAPASSYGRVTNGQSTHWAGKPRKPLRTSKKAKRKVHKAEESEEAQSHIL